MTRAATLALERAAAMSPTADTLYEALPGHLRRLVGSGPVFVAAVDPVTLHFVREARRDIPDEAASRFFAHEVGVPDVAKFRALAVARDPLDTLFRATGRAPRRSARWREVIEPLGWGDELRVALRDAGRTWGVLCLHRTAVDPPFDGDDLAAIRRVVPLLASAFRRTTLAGATAKASTSNLPGVVVLDRQLVVTSMTEVAAEWLDLLGATGDGLPIVVMSSAVQTITSGRAQSVAVVARDGRWLSVHASPLHGPGPDAVAVVLQPAHPTDAFPAFAAAAQLTPRETEVAAALLRGLSDRAIARVLGVGEYTVQGHLKSIYQKSGTRGRAELVARLLLR